MFCSVCNELGCLVFAMLIKTDKEVVFLKESDRLVEKMLQVMVGSNMLGVLR